MLGERIRMLRTERGWTLIDLARRVNRDKSTLSSIENDNAKPSRKLIEALSAEFNVSSDYLLGLSDDAQSESYSTNEFKQLLDRVEDLPEEKRLIIMIALKAMVKGLESDTEK